MEGNYNNTISFPKFHRRVYTLSTDLQLHVAYRSY